jgi:hypothetical protein
VIDHAKSKLPQKSTLSVDKVADEIRRAYEQQRSDQAESSFLKPIGWTLKRFNSEASKKVLPEALRIQLYAAVSKYELPIQLLVAGFDGRRGRVFTIGRHTRGLVQRQDIPGFQAIGSGSTGARYMLYYRRASIRSPLRQMVYYALEAKYFGELAGGVGTRTDLVVLQRGREIIRFSESTIEKKLIKLCQRLEPRELTPNPVKVLNELPELERAPKIEALKIENEWTTREVPSKRRR